MRKVKIKIDDTTAFSEHYFGYYHGPVLNNNGQTVALVEDELGYMNKVNFSKITFCKPKGKWKRACKALQKELGLVKKKLQALKKWKEEHQYDKDLGEVIGMERQRMTDLLD